MSDFREVTRLFGLEDKVAVVTGGAAGIGKAVARLLTDAGACVVIADRNLESAQSLAGELGNTSSAIAFDLKDESSIIALFAAVHRKHNRLDILVNNAGIYPKYPLDTLTEQQWQEMQTTNVWGCFAVLREASRLMRAARNGGRIVNISSIGAIRTAVNDQIAYNASKAALDSMTLSAALDLARYNILVNSILPGAVKPLDPKVAGAYHAPPSGPLLDPGRILLGRPALPEEIAAPLLMLVSAGGSYITGQTLVIDGGFSIS